MNIWRIAGSVAAFSAASLVAFYISANRLDNLDFHILLDMTANVLFCGLFVFTMVLFPYYWFKMAKFFFFFHFSKNQPLTSEENASDLKGIAVSFVLVLLTLWLGKTYFSGGGIT